ncbi:MAG TPA: FCD domain-containing protein [Bryobacteraceae bacterium]|nr:FCD domain-containing protein [Bryobacteraceae bacterium]
MIPYRLRSGNTGNINTEGASSTLISVEAAPTRSLTHDVRDTMLAWIRDGKFPAGAQLPSVPDLVSQFQVSRTVVREALQALSGMNLIEIRPGLGCFVKLITSDLVVNADVLASLLGREAIVKVVAARKVIEGGVARLAATTATEEDFEELEEILRKIERAARRGQPMYSLTPQFHIAIASATHNEVLEKVVSSFNLVMASGGALIERENGTPEYRMAEYESHRELYEALRSRDPERAQRTMEAHVTETLNALDRLPET